MSDPLKEIFRQAAMRRREERRQMRFQKATANEVRKAFVRDAVERAFERLKDAMKGGKIG